MNQMVIRVLWRKIKPEKKDMGHDFVCGGKG
jgi:hypothetical protein